MNNNKEKPEERESGKAARTQTLPVNGNCKTKFWGKNGENLRGKLGNTRYPVLPKALFLNFLLPFFH